MIRDRGVIIVFAFAVALYCASSSAARAWCGAVVERDLFPLSRLEHVAGAHAEIGCT